MSAKPDFAELRRQRDEARAETIKRLCEEHGIEPSAIHLSGGQGCYCACPDGPCEHEWGGWQEFDEGRGGEQVCQLCGMGAMHHSLRTGP